MTRGLTKLAQDHDKLLIEVAELRKENKELKEEASLIGKILDLFEDHYTTH